MHIYLAKSSRFESTDFASVMIDDVGCIRRHQCPQCDFSYHEKCCYFIIKEYRGPTLRPPCDVIDDVIIMKILFLASFGTIFSYLRSNWSCVYVKYFKIFKMAAILSSRQTSLPEVIPEVEYTRKIAMSISDILSFWSTLQLRYWRRHINFKIWPTVWPGDVIDDAMRAWNITCPTRHPQQCTRKILFVWHQSFIVKSSGQTSW